MTLCKDRWRKDRWRKDRWRKDKWRTDRKLTRCLTVFLAAVLPAARGEAQTSGKVGAVNQDATGTPPGAPARTLVVGSGVVYKERIKTSPTGSTQIIFPDQSTLNVGRGSSLVIDDFVYSPKTGSGTMIASLGKGTLRFVGGQISHTKGATINTPVASLGIRGGIASIMYPVPREIAELEALLAEARGELVIGHVGILKLKNEVSEVLVRPGFATYVNGKNTPIPEPFRISDAVLAAIVKALTSGPGQSGGVKTRGVDELVVLKEIGRTLLEDPAHPPGSDPLDYLEIFAIGNDVARSKSQALQTQNVVTPPPVVARRRPAPTPPPTVTPPPYGGGSS